MRGRGERGEPRNEGRDGHRFVGHKAREDEHPVGVSSVREPGNEGTTWSCEKVQDEALMGVSSVRGQEDQEHGDVMVVGGRVYQHGVDDRTPSRWPQGPGVR